MKKTFPVPRRAPSRTIDDFPKALYNKEDCLFPLGIWQGGLNAIVVLGIDPGYALMGWGVVESEGSRMKLLGYGCVETKAGVPMQHRLRTLQLSIRDLVNIYQPDDVAFEELFFARNVTTALMVGAARGAAIIAAAE